MASWRISENAGSGTMAHGVPDGQGAGNALGAGASARVVAVFDTICQ